MGDQQTSILAIVTTDQQQTSGGGVPVFLVEDAAQLQQVSVSLSNILDASAHEINEQLMIVVKH